MSVLSLKFVVMYMPCCDIYATGGVERAWKLKGLLLYPQTPVNFSWNLWRQSQFQIIDEELLAMIRVSEIITERNHTLCCA